MKHDKEQIIRSVLDFIPTILFFLSYWKFNLYVATAVIAVSMVICLIVGYIIFRSFSKQGIFMTILVVVFASLTLGLHDERFIKMKITFIELFLASILLFGVIRKKYFLKSMLSSLALKENAYKVLTWRVIGLLTAIAISNEIIWRTQSTSFWVGFKTIGVPSIMFLFIIVNLPFILKNSNENLLKK